MRISDWSSDVCSSDLIASVLLLAAAILPATLVFLMLTNKLAVSEGGARYIYGNAFWVGFVSLALALYTLILAIGEGPSHYFSVPFVVSVVLSGAVLVCGFFMPTQLRFQLVGDTRAHDPAPPPKRLGGHAEVAGRRDGDWKGGD